MDTARVRALYDRMAPRYDRAIAVPEAILFRGAREWVGERASGLVCELAAGTARMLPHYGRRVRQVVAIELSEEMARLAARRAHAVDLPVGVVVGDAQVVPLAGGAFDTVVVALGLCTVPDDRAAIAEARRLLRPGGSLLLLEHVRSPHPLVRAGQRVLAPLARRQGDHLLRDPLDHLGALGFTPVELRRQALGITLLLHARAGG